LGLPVVKLIPKKDKFSRALPLSALAEGGKILINRNINIASDIEKELVNFPNGKHDDIVDALSYAVEMLSRKSNIKPVGRIVNKPEKYSLFR
jgi:predicted phage terminase large subunit-like protein